MSELDVKINLVYNALQSLREDMDTVAAEMERADYCDSASLMRQAESLASMVCGFIEDSKSKIKEDVDYIKCASCDRLIVKE